MLGLAQLRRTQAHLQIRVRVGVRVRVRVMARVRVRVRVRARVRVRVMARVRVRARARVRVKCAASGGPRPAAKHRAASRQCSRLGRGRPVESSGSVVSSCGTQLR